jgi:hypothetical protein
VEGAATFEAWIAPQAYPWNWSAIVERKNRYFFGLDATGHIAVRANIDKQWRECVSSAQIPFMQWSHIAATFDPNKGLTLYINGQNAGQLAVRGHLDGGGGGFQIGRNLEEVPAAASRKIPSSFSFDGIIDELKIYSRALDAGELAKSYESTRPSSPPPLTWRKLPQIPNGQKHLPVLHEFEVLSGVGPDLAGRISDPVVTFDDASYKMVFCTAATTT